MIADKQNAAYEQTYGSPPSPGVSEAASRQVPRDIPGTRPGASPRPQMPQQRPQPSAGRGGVRKGNVMDALAVFGGLAGG